MQSLTEVLGALLGVWLAQSPVLLVWLGGIGAALVFWRRHPTASLLTIIALATLLVMLLISDFLSVWLPVTLVEQGSSTAQVAGVLSVIGLMISLINAAAWVLLLLALFGWRSGRVASSE